MDCRECNLMGKGKEEYKRTNRAFENSVISASLQIKVLIVANK